MVAASDCSKPGKFLAKTAGIARTGQVDWKSAKDSGKFVLGVEERAGEAARNASNGSLSRQVSKGAQNVRFHFELCVDLEDI